jgi:hypothetical protein
MKRQVIKIINSQFNVFILIIILCFQFFCLLSQVLYEKCDCLYCDRGVFFDVVNGICYGEHSVPGFYFLVLISTGMSALLDLYHSRYSVWGHAVA